MSKAMLVQHGEVEATLQPVSGGTMGMIERAVSDPNFNAENFRTLVEFRDREIARNAQDAFNAAMAAAQGEMRPIEADANNPRCACDDCEQQDDFQRQEQERLLTINQLDNQGATQ